MGSFFLKYVSDRFEAKYNQLVSKGEDFEEKLIENIRAIKSNMDTLSKLFQQNLKSLYVDFIKDHLDSDYEITMDNFNDFVFENELSIVAPNYLCHLGVANIQNSDEELRLNYQATRNIHCAFMEYCNENNGIVFPDGYTSLRNENYLFYKYKNNANDYIENELGISSYECKKDGETFPLYECPECEEDQLVYDEKDGKYHCFSCDKDFTTDELSFCERFGSIMKTNKDWAICQNCIDDLNKE